MPTVCDIGHFMLAISMLIMLEAILISVACDIGPTKVVHLVLSESMQIVSTISTSCVI